jgi:hypothetical protein
MRKIRNMDGVVRVQPIYKSSPLAPQVNVRLQTEETHRLPGKSWWVKGALSTLILAAFVSGAYLTWSAGLSEAELKDQAPEVLVPAGSRPLEVDLSVYDNNPAQVPDTVFFSLTLDQLENFLAEHYKTEEVKQAEKLATRKEKLKLFLEEKHSPFVSIVDALAELKHWKMVLAISNSESSLGKRCYTNNCSGIGVEPGHPLWREYESTADWAKDLDSLLERRYKNWTLEKMNGTYNKPGSNNWLSASRQILEELQAKGIE